MRFSTREPGPLSCGKVVEISPPLPVTDFVVLLVVAGSAEAHQIILCMNTTFGHGNDVVYFLCGNKSASLLALLTERMLADVAVSNTLPRTAIFLVDVGSTFVLVVLLSCCGFVLLTVLTIRQVGATGIGAGALGFAGHFIHLLWHNKSLTGLLP